MAVRMVPDVGAPALVFGLDQLTKRAMPEYNEWITYIETVGGYLGAWMGWGGDFLKNVGVASLPATLNLITAKVAGGASQRLSFKKVARYPAPAPVAPYQGVRLV